MYDRYFVRRMLRHLQSTCGSSDENGGLTRAPRGLQDFDELYTAPTCGFADASSYYSASSAAQFVPTIRLPAHILTSRDDPLIPFEPFSKLVLPPAVKLHVTDSGGHLGFLGRRGIDPDIRWMDWRVRDWLMALDHGARDSTPRRNGSRARATDLQAR